MDIIVNPLEFWLGVKENSVQVPKLDCLTLPKWVFSLSVTHNVSFSWFGHRYFHFFGRGKGILNIFRPALLLSCTIHLKRPSSASGPWVYFKDESKDPSVHLLREGFGWWGEGREWGAALLLPSVARYSASSESIISLSSNTFPRLGVTVRMRDDPHRTCLLLFMTV